MPKMLWMQVLQIPQSQITKAWCFSMTQATNSIKEICRQNKYLTYLGQHQEPHTHPNKGFVYCHLSYSHTYSYHLTIVKAIHWNQLQNPEKPCWTILLHQPGIRQYFWDNGHTHATSPVEEKIGKISTTPQNKLGSQTPFIKSHYMEF